MDTLLRGDYQKKEKITFRRKKLNRKWEKKL